MNGTSITFRVSHAEQIELARTAEREKINLSHYVRIRLACARSARRRQRCGGRVYRLSPHTTARSRASRSLASSRASRLRAPR